MKKVITLLLIVFVSAQIRTNAQIPNGDFETILSDGSLSNWGNVTLFAVIIDSTGSQMADSIVFDGPLCGPSTDAHSGYFSLQMSNAYDYTAGSGIGGWASADDDTVYTAWGALEYLVTSLHPQELNFYYKYLPVNGDSGIARITFYDDMANTVGEGTMIFGDLNSSYTYGSIPIVYTSPNPVSYYSLHFGNYFSQADYPTGGNFGTRLLIDDVNFSGNSSISEEDFENEILLYPNPCRNQLSIQNSASNEFVIYDITGKEIQSGILGSDSKIILNANLQSGIYFLELKKGHSVNRKSFIVN